MMRTHMCGELRKKDIGKEVELCGWVSRRRDHGIIIFVDIRDRTGISQLVFNKEHNKEAYDIAFELRREDVIKAKGKANKREDVNKDIPTGDVEVVCDSLEIISKAEKLPMELNEDIESTEETRLRYRYIDLRKPRMQKNLKIRHEAAMAAREFFNKNGFLEIETPMLVRATPEGARDYIVPSRVNKGKFYALPQSPQLYKQILMISGVDRYFQFARCLRDEDLRQDRQPEHTQMDLEMSFVNEKDIMNFCEGLYKHIFKKVLNIELKGRFPVLKYDEAIEKYGTDKPDLRFKLELKDLSEIAAKSEFKIFKDVLKSKGAVKCIIVEKELGRKDIDKLEKEAKKNGAKGLAWMKLVDKFEGGISKFFDDKLQKETIKETGAKKGSTLLFIADERKKANLILGSLRSMLGRELKLIDEKEFKFCWVVDFPLFEWDEEFKKWTPAHHMFSMPKKEFIKYLEKEPGKVIANLIDIVLNGVELGSGGLRIHDPKLQEKVMKVIGLSHEDAVKKFGFLLDAYNYGSPVHGGMGLGFDRLVALMVGENDIREVIAFPKNKNAECPMDGSPNEVSEEQLDEVNISKK